MKLQQDDNLGTSLKMQGE